MSILVGLLFLISQCLGNYDPNSPKMRCNPQEGDGPRSWGPHNVLPNLYEHVYRPFLDAFTYTVSCKHEFKIPRECENVKENGTLIERCAFIEADGMLAQYALVIQYFTGLNLYDSITMQVVQECNVILRKSDAEFQPHRECRRSTLAYQCVWNNALWLTIPVVFLVVFNLILLGVIFLSVLMVSIE